MAVTSNRDYITSAANGISSSVNSSSVMGGITKSTFSESTASCPSLEPNLVETFLGTCKEVFRRIGEDSANVSKIGDGFVSMDNAMAGVATSLNMEIKSFRHAIGESVLSASSDADSLTNASVRKKIEEILTAKGADFKLEDRSGTEPAEESPGEYWNVGSPSSSSSGTPAPSELPTIAPTEIPTDMATDTPTEAPVEKPTENKTEMPTEKQTEIQTEKPTEIITQVPTAPVELPTAAPAEKPQTPTKKPTGTKPVSSDVEAPTIPVEVPTIVEEPYIETNDIEIEEPINDEIVEELPEPIIEDDYIEEEYVTPEIIDIPVEPVTKKSGSGIGTAAAIIGAGAAIGGVVYGANKFLKNREENEEEVDWGDEEE